MAMNTVIYGESTTATITTGSTTKPALERQKITNGAALVSDAISLSGNAQGTVSLSTTAAQSAALTGGVYDVWSDVDCYIKVAATANDVTTSTGYLLRANNTIPIIVPDQEKLGGIVASGTGTLSYHRVK